MEYVYTEDSKEKADEMRARIDAEPFVQDVRKKAESLGYLINWVFVRQRGSWETIELCACPASDDDRYLPDVRHYHPWKGEGRFEMNTASFGSLSGEELGKFVSAVNRGAELTKFLSSLDWKKAPVVVFKE